MRSFLWAATHYGRNWFASAINRSSVPCPALCEMHSTTFRFGVVVSNRKWTGCTNDRSKFKNRTRNGHPKSPYAIQNSWKSEIYGECKIGRSCNFKRARAFGDKFQNFASMHSNKDRNICATENDQKKVLFGDLDVVGRTSFASNARIARINYRAIWILTWSQLMRMLFAALGHCATSTTAATIQNG